MSVFQRWGKKAADTIKTAMKDKTKEDISKQVDIWTPVVTMAGILLIVGTAMKPHHHTIPSAMISPAVPHAGAGTIVNLYMGKGCE